MSYRIPVISEIRGNTICEKFPENLLFPIAKRAKEWVDKIAINRWQIRTVAEKLRVSSEVVNSGRNNLKFVS